MPIRRNVSSNKTQLATAFALAGGTGLFLLAASTSGGRTVSVRAPHAYLNDTDREGSESTQRRFHQTDKRRDINKRFGDKNDGRMPVVDIDALISTMIDDSIRTVGVVFTAAGRIHTHTNISVDLMHPEYAWMLKSSNGDYSELKEYINRTVELFSKTKDIVNRKS